MRHKARYCIGGCPTISVNRSARTDRETPTSRASRSTVHASLGSPCSAPSACPTTGSRKPASQPVCGGRQRLDVTADRLHEHELGEAREDVLRARTRAARLLQRDVEQHSQPFRRRAFAARGEMDHRGQRGEQRIEGTLVAAQETADEPRPLGASASHLVDERQRRRPARELRQVGSPSHPRRAGQDVRVALGQHEEVSLLHAERLLADGVSPARPSRDHVVFDDALGARHHGGGDIPRGRGLRHPRGAEVEVEIDGAGQADRAQHVGEDVRAHAGTSCAGRAGKASGRWSRSSPLSDGMLGKSDAAHGPGPGPPP